MTGTATITAATRTSRIRSLMIGAMLFIVALFAFATAASTANAAYDMTAWDMDLPDTLQAGGHSKVTYYANFDASSGWSTGDDIKKVIVDYPAGLLANPETTAAGKCTETQYLADTCPATSKIADVQMTIKTSSSIFVAPTVAAGGVYVMAATDPGAAATIAFIVRPANFRKIFLKSKATGVVGVRGGPDGDYGLTLTIDNIPTTLTKTTGGVQEATLSRVWVQTPQKVNNKYFSYLPTRCDLSRTRIQATSAKGIVMTPRYDSFTATGCANVPFTPTGSVTPTSTTIGSPVGWNAVFNVDQTEATIQQSHVKNVTVDLPVGTTLNFPGIAAIPTTCSDSELLTDSCPAGSKIGTASAAVPFLVPPTGSPAGTPSMPGDIYLMSRLTSVQYGYVLRSKDGMKATLKGSIGAWDNNNDGTSDWIRATALTLPQAPWSQVKMNFTTQMINNPAKCATSPVTSKLDGYSGKSVTVSNSITFLPPANTPCPGTNNIPAVSVNSPTNNSSLTSRTVPVSFTATDADASQTLTVKCELFSSSNLTLPLATDSACTSPKTFNTGADGDFTVKVTATDSANPPGVASAQTAFKVDSIAPNVVVTSPANDGSVNTTGNQTLEFLAQDIAPSSGLKPVTCVLTRTAPTTATIGTDTNCTTPKSYSGLTNGSYSFSVSAQDNAGNSNSAVRTFTVNIPVDNVGPSINITAPTEGQVLTSSTVNAVWGITDSAQAGAVVSGVNAASVLCSVSGPTNVAETSCTTTGKSFTNLSNGDYSLTVKASDNQGNPSQATRGFKVNVADTVAPIVTINTPTAGQVLTSSTANATWGITDSAQAGVTASGVNDGQTTCSLVLAPSTTVSATGPCPGNAKSFNGLVNGSYTLTVTGKDNAGNTSTPATRSFSVNAPTDNLGPIITGPSVVVTGNSAEATFSAVDTAPAGVTPSGLAGFNCTLTSGATTISAKSSCVSPRTYGGLSNGNYLLTVEALDNLSNASTATASFTIAVPDNVAPTVTINTPAAAAVLTSSTVNATWTTNDTAQSGVSPSGVNDALTTCSLVNTTTSTTVFPTGTCSGNAKTFSSLVNGAYTLTVTATDNAGNVGLPTTRSFTVAVADNVAPTGSVSSPTEGQILTSSSVNPTWTVSDTAQAGVAASGVNDSQTTCTLVLLPSTTVSTGACTGLTKGFTNLVNGNYLLTVNIKDFAGNAGSFQRNFTIAVVDNVGPNVNITAPTENQNFTSGTVNATWTITDVAQAGVSPSGTADAQTTCTLVTGATTVSTGACTGFAKTFTGLANGSYTLTVIGKDNAGNSNSGTRNFSVGVPDNVAPSVVINTPTASQVLTTNSASATWTSADTAQAGVTASGVNDAQTSCTLTLLPSTTVSTGLCPGSAKVFSSLVNGSYTLSVTVRDNAGNIAAPVTRNFSVAVVDNVGPSINITNPTENQSFTSSTVVANWILTDQAQAGVTPVGVNDAQTTCVLTSGAATIVPSGPCTGLTKTFTGLANANYTLSITAKDTLGNSTTTPRNFTVGAIDNQGPTINITNPTDNQVFTTNAVTAAWTLTDVAQAGVTPSGVNDAQTTCSLVLLPSTTVSASGPCTGLSKAFTNLANGSYTLTVVARDNVGNTTTTPRNFSVNVADTVAPTVVINTPTAGQTFTVNSVTATWTPTDTAQSGVSPSGINDAQTTCQLVNTTTSTTVFPTGACTGNTKTFSTLANGAYSLTVTVRDNAGNIGTPVSRSFNVAVVDNVGPAVNITAPTEGQTITTDTVNASWILTDQAQAGVTPVGVNDAQTTCSLVLLPSTTVSTGACTGGAKTFTNLANGNYQLTVVAKDTLGNTNQLQRNFIVNRPIDNIAPTVSITTPAVNEVLTVSSASVAFTASDTAQAGAIVSGVNPALTNCTLTLLPSTVISNAPCGTSPKLYSGLANGNYTVSIYAVDNQGNSGAGSPTTRSFSVAVPGDNQGPTITISAPTAGQTFTVNSVTAAWGITDTAQAGSPVAGVDNSTVKCSLSGGPTVVAEASCGLTGQSFSNLANGTYNLNVNAKDLAGNLGQANRSFTIAVVDNQGPTINYTSPAAGAVLTSNSLTATWGLVDNAQVGVTPVGVNDSQTTCSLVLLPSTVVSASGPCTGGSKAFTNLANGSYTLTVVARDTLGNTTTTTRNFSVAVPDQVGPSVTIATPTQNQVLTTNSAAATWSITDNAQAGVTPVGVNAALTTCSLTGPTPSASTTCTGNAKTFNNLDNGTYQLTVTATDLSGNVGTPATRDFTVAVVDNVAPTVTINTPTNGQVFTVSNVTATWTSADTAQSGVAASGVNDAQTTCSLVNTTTSTTVFATGACTGSTKAFTGLANGAYTLTVNVRDNAGNIAAPVTRNFSVAVVDNVAPTVTINTPTNGQVLTSNVANATWTSADTAQAGVTASGVNDTLTTCSLVNTTTSTTVFPTGACTGSAKSFTGLANASYTLTVNVRDNAGNIAAPVTRNFSVAVADNVGPTVNITAPTEGQTLASGNVVANWTLTDQAQAGVTPVGVNDALTTCQLINTTTSTTVFATGACTGLTKTFNGLANANYQLTVTGRDTLSNVGTGVRNFTVGVIDNVAPTVVINTPTNGQVLTTNVANATWTSADTAQAGVTASGVNDAQTTCSLVTGATTVFTGACTGSAKSFTNLVNGAYTLTVNVRDNAGNIAAPVTRDFSVNAPDTVAPTVVINTPTNGQVLTSNVANATWTSADTAQAGVSASGVNDTLTTCSLVNTTTSTTVFPTGACTGSAKSFTGLANASYTLTVNVRDNAGNIAAPVTRNFSVAVADNVGPTVNITAPTEGQNFTVSTVNATWTLTDQAQSGVTPVGVNDALTTCQLINTTTSTTVFPTGACTGLAKTFTGLANGTYTLTVNGRDTLSNVGTQVRTFTVGVVDNIAPTVAISAPTEGQTLTVNSASVAFLATDTAQAGVTPSGVASTTCTLNLGATVVSAAASCGTSPKLYSNLVNGNYTVRIFATDAAGNSGSASPTVRNFTIAVPDNVAPTVTIDNPTNAQILTSSTVVANWTSADTAQAGVTASGVNDAQTTCSLVLLPSTTVFPTGACTGSTKTFTNLVNGNYTLTVNVRDNAGNIAGAVTRNFSVAAVDNVGPTINITAPTEGQSFTTAGSNTVVANWTLTDTAQAGVTPSGVNDSQTTCQLINTTTSTTVFATGACTGLTKTFSALANGNYTLTVNAKDVANNTNSAVRNFIVNLPVANPQTTLTTYGSAAAKSNVSLTVVATTDIGAGMQYSVNGGGAWTDCAFVTATKTGTCSIPLSSFAAAAAAGTTAGYQIRATSGAAGATPVDLSPELGYTWADDRNVLGTAVVTPLSNASTAAMGGIAPNTPGAHPDVQATVDLAGAEDARTVTIQLADGLMGSLAAVPKANRCTVKQGLQGNCPASAEIATGTGKGVSVKYGALSGVADVTGSVYMVDPDSPAADEAAGFPDIASAYAAGGAVEITSPSHPDLGRIVVMGTLKVIDNGRALVIDVQDLPRQTNLAPESVAWAPAAARPFHATQIVATVNGAKGYVAPASVTPTNKSRPLITNPHYCGAQWAARPQMKYIQGTAITWDGNPITDGNTAPGFNGKVSALYNTAASGATCISSQAFNPQIASATLTNPVKGATTGVNANGTLGEEADALNANKPISTVTYASTQLPPYVGVSTPSVGANTDQCTVDTFVGLPPQEVFDTSIDRDPGVPGIQPACPPQAVVGTAYVDSPLVDTQLVGDIYYVVGSPIPNIGVKIAPNVQDPRWRAYSDAHGGDNTLNPYKQFPNPQGIDIGIVGKTSVPDYAGSEWFKQINVDDGMRYWHNGNCVADVNTGQTCNDAIKVTITSLADVPITNLNLQLGDRPAAWRPKDGGGTLDQNPLVIAGCSDPTFPTTESNGTRVGPPLLTRFTPYSKQTVQLNTQTAIQTLIPKNFQPITGCSAAVVPVEGDLVDEDAPVVTITAPTNGQTIASHTVNAAWTIADINSSNGATPSGVDDTLTTCELTLAPASVPMDTGSCPGNAKTYTGLVNGTYTLKVIAKDKTANSTSNTYTRTFTVAGP